MLSACRQIFGVTLLTLRSSVRTGTMGAVFLLVTILLAALPPLLKGDGTVEGRASVLITYTLGAVFVALAVSTLWGSCSLFATEISSSRLGLTWVKPITALRLYFGKFLAVLLINALALSYAAGTVCLLLPKSFREGHDSVSVVRPIMPSVREEAEQVYEEMKKADSLPEGLSRRRIIRTLIRRAPDRYTAISSGDSVSWTFRVPEAFAPGDLPMVRMNFETEWNSRQVASATCRLSPGDGNGVFDDFKAVSVPSVRAGRAVLTFPLPERQFAGVKEVRAVLEYGSRTAGDATLLTRFRKDVALTRTGVPFWINLSRALIIHLGALAAISALGLALGAAFSFPVAAFTGTLVLILFSVSGSVVRSVSDEETDTMLKRAGFVIAEQVDRTIDSVVDANALDALVDGEEISGRKTMLSALRSGIILPFGVFGLLACAALKRRDKQEES